MSWAVAPATRHAMATHPRSAYFFHLAANALIMNPTKSLKSHILEKDRLEELMMKDVPIVPPDSIIKTFAHQKDQDVDLIITQDAENLNPGSFILKNGEYARFFLDAWFDPLYRNYNFAKAETHGLVRLIVYSIALSLYRSSFESLDSNRNSARITSCSGTRLSLLEPPWSLSAL